MPGNIELSAIEVALVNAMSRETVLRTYVNVVKHQYDFVLIDCMPSLGMMTINSLAAADSVLIPVQSHYLPAKGMAQLLQTIARVRRQINPKLIIEGVLLTMVDHRTNFAKDISFVLRRDYGDKLTVFNTEIPISIRAAETSAKGKSIFAYDPNNPVAMAYEALTREVRSLDMIGTYCFDAEQVNMIKELMSAKHTALFMQLVNSATGQPAMDWSNVIDVPAGGMDIPLYLQGDYPQTVCYIDNVAKSVKSSGCGATSVSMVIAYLTGNTSQTPYTLFKWAYENGYYDGNGLGHSCLTKLASLYGVSGAPMSPALVLFPSNPFMNPAICTSLSVSMVQHIIRTPNICLMKTENGLLSLTDQ